MIKIVDSIMGKGKTSYCIQMINENQGKRYIYITPYLDEVERIKEKCQGFEEPKSSGETGELKLDNFNQLIKEGKNIVSTHALFKLTSKETIKHLKDNNYTLIIDETMEVISQEEIKRDDLVDIIERGHAHVEENTGVLMWLNDHYDGAHNRVRRLCQTRSIVVVNQSALVWVLPPKIFKCFEEVYICTYRFETQVMRYYLDMNEMKFEIYKVANWEGKYELIRKQAGEKEDTSSIKIDIYLGKKNDIGSVSEGRRKKAEYLLSHSWYKKASKEKLKRLRNNILGYFQNDMRSPGEKNIWTTFKEFRKDLQGKGYTKGFLACNARAINSYKDRTCIAYTINRFMNPYIVKFFESKGIPIDKEQQLQCALSELLQFLFRSAVREGQKVNLYIPSIRMRNALQDWLGQPKE